MHIIAINLPDLLLGLWRGTIDCDKDDSKDTWDWVVLVGDVWKSHGKDVALCRPYLPGCFDRPPRNVADKINSGFWAWELLVYMFGYCPALLYGTLPRRYWHNFCKVVSAVRLLQQCTVSVQHVQRAHLLVLDFTEEYKALYYRRMVSRLHFCRQSVHGLSHLAQDVTHLGPGAYSSQWTLERTISNLGQEIKQPSNPYANLANCSLHRSQLSALHAILPDLEPDDPILPRGAVDLGDGYILLRAQDETSVRFYGERADAIRAFLVTELRQGALQVDWVPKYIRWARLRLPNLQIACCVWKENSRKTAVALLHFSRNIKFFFWSEHSGVVHTYALISVWSEPDATLLQESVNMVYSCAYSAKMDLRVIEVKLIQSVVAMIPMTPRDGDRSPRFFLLEKPGLEITHLGDIATSNHSE
ncbi:hypothetical protein EI94DRAFT_1610749 [Lactarius quietus]|nr:hypothetical protein EI94DRAFT_1610749 [Lactarius quietus]